MMFTMRFPGGLDKTFTMSYDDGVIQDVRLLSVMKKNGLRGTFNINTGLFSKEDVKDDGRMSYRQVLELYQDPDCEVAVHAYTHPHLELMSMPEITRQIYQDKEKLEEMFGCVVRGMAYPFGSYNETVIECMKAVGIGYSRTTVSTEGFRLPDDWMRLPATCHHNNPRLTELGEKFLNSKARVWDAPMMFYLWGHSYEFDRNENWEKIERFAELIGGHEDVWYATNIEICDYVKAFRSMRISSDGKVIENPTSLTLWYAENDGVHSIAPGERIRF